MATLSSRWHLVAGIVELTKARHKRLRSLAVISRLGGLRKLKEGR
jgi:hypothetical protein